MSQKKSIIIAAKDGAKINNVSGKKPALVNAAVAVIFVFTSMLQIVEPLS